MTAKNDRFWAKVLFREFIKHYRKMNDEQIVRDVRQSMDDLDDLVDDTDTFGSKMVRWSVGRAEQYPMASENGKKGGRPRKKKETTADGDIREDSQDLHDGSNSGISESGTSANLYGDAATREGADESTTVSKNMPRVGQNGAHPRNQGGGRAVQGAMSHAPSVPAQDGKFRGSAKNQGESNTGSTVPAVRPESGNIYDQETSRISTNEARQSQGRTGAPSTGATSSTAPVRSYRPRKVPHPKGDYEVFDFASENGIPDWVASEFYQRFFVERDGTDTDGNNIDNWKGALINYGKSRKRETA